MEYLLAFHIAGVVMALVLVYRPAYIAIKEMQPTNILIKYSILGWIVVTILFTLILPALIPSILSEDLRWTFIKGFVESALRHTNGKD